MWVSGSEVSWGEIVCISLCILFFVSVCFVVGEFVIVRG